MPRHRASARIAGGSDTRWIASRAKEADKGELTELAAAWSGPSRSIAVSYISLTLPLKHGKKFSLALAGAQVQERRGRMRIERTASLLPDDGSLLLAPPSPDGGQTVTLTLAPPFAGSASYESLPGMAPTWTGSLRARLPGAEAVSLAGKRFVAAFCQGSSAKEVERCSRPVAAERERFGATGR